MKIHTLPPPAETVNVLPTENYTEHTEEVIPIPVDSMQLRVRDGSLEWYDGVRWNLGATVEELVAADPIAQPSDAWHELVAQAAETRASEYATELAALNREDNSLSVDEVVAAKPRATTSSSVPSAKPTVTQPTAPTTTVPATNYNDNNGNSDNSNDRGSEPEAAPPAPEPAPPAPAPPAPAPDPAPDTGDGEDIEFDEWSGDYE